MPPSRPNWKRGRAYFEEGCEEVVGEVDLDAGRSYSIVVEFSRRPPYVLDIPGIQLGIGRKLGDEEIAEAVAAARDAETAIVVIGRNAEWDTEGSDLADIELPGRHR